MLPFCNLLIQQTFIKGPLYFGHCARLNTKMNRKKTSAVLKCLTGVFSCRMLWVTTAYSLGQTTTPGHQVIKCIFPRVSCILWKVYLGQGTVDITLFDCAPGDWPCCSEAIPFCEVNVRVHGWGTGREVFSAQALRSLSVGTSCSGQWWEMPASYSWRFGTPGSLGSEVGVWLFFLKGGIVPASC